MNIIKDEDIVRSLAKARAEKSGHWVAPEIVRKEKKDMVDDMIGKRFYSLIVTDRDADYISPSDGRLNYVYHTKLFIRGLFKTNGILQELLNNRLGNLTMLPNNRTVKNKICGDMGICGIGAAQATTTGKVADSAKIGRNASTIALIQDKTPEETEADGVECGNKKLRVILNRNGMQMSPEEYIDLFFDGNHIMYSEAKQHIPQSPY